MAALDVAALRGELETASPLDVFVAPWFPTTLHALQLDRLLALAARPVLATDDDSLVHDTAVMEVAQRYASRTPVSFDTDVPSEATRAAVRTWWKRTFNRTAEYLEATTFAPPDVLYFCRSELAFGYDADVTVRTSAVETAACHGDRASLVGALRSSIHRSIGLLGAGTPPSLLEALLDTDESDRETCVGILAIFGHAALLDEMKREASAPSVGSARHRRRIVRQGTALLAFAATAQAARTADRHRLIHHLIASAAAPSAMQEPRGCTPAAAAAAEPATVAASGWLARGLAWSWMPVRIPSNRLRTVATDSHSPTESARDNTTLGHLPGHGELSSLLAPAIGLARSRWPILDVLSEAALPLGGSRFGGLPDLPPAVAWPTWGDEPLDFMLQINLAEVAACCNEGDGTALLPARGWLWYFFDTEMDGYETSIPESKLLLYWDGPVTLLRRRTRHPRDAALDDDDVGEFGTGYGAHPLIPCRITTFSPLDPAPVGFAPEDLLGLRALVSSAWDQPSALEPGSQMISPGPLVHLAIGGWSSDVHLNSLQLLGHPTVIQNDIFHELVDAHDDGEDAAEDEMNERDEWADGLDPNASKRHVEAGAEARSQPRKRLRVAKEAQNEGWLLLLQIPSDHVRYYAGDHRRRGQREIDDHLLYAGGTLYICIRRRDLIARRFDRTQTVYQQT